MCGFAGYFTKDTTFFDTKAENILRNMSSAISHRGPDSVGYWYDGRKGLAFTHRRLAILDLSVEGAQPMHSSTGRYVLVLNGEIYNHKELRSLLEAQQTSQLGWRGYSDTESLLMCFEHWGIEKTLQLSKGMFAFALWDYVNDELVLARDRFGEKPLYYGWQGKGISANFLFASELSALQQHPAFEDKIDRHSVANFLNYKCVPGEQSIFSGIRKLEPGALLKLTKNQLTEKTTIWWDTRKEFFSAKEKKFTMDKESGVLKLESLLTNAIEKQMQADVPLGAFLSGGIDSSLIVALMQKQDLTRVNTFSIGFNESAYNEAIYAKAVAEHLHTQHTEIYVSHADAFKVIPELPKVYSEPFADSSQIPTYLLSKLVGQNVTVALSGDAGDELFCGYNRYKFTAKSWRYLSRVPLSIRKIIFQTLKNINPVLINRFGELMGRNLLGDKLLKGSLLLKGENVSQIYESLVSDWDINDTIMLDYQTNNNQIKIKNDCFQDINMIEEMMLNDTLAYLVDDILVKVDRAAMANGLETRIPFLDQDVVKFSWQLPLDYKLNKGITKWPLRQILFKYVPKELIERPKMGFGIPIDQWLRGPLRDWAEELLNKDRLKEEEFFDVEKVRTIWDEHLSEKRNWQGRIWSILMFQAWYDNHKNA
jgi:asparagine synthase (glutamine-hydrolysing)